MVGHGTRSIEVRLIPHPAGPQSPTRPARRGAHTIDAPLVRPVHRVTRSTARLMTDLPLPAASPHGAVRCRGRAGQWPAMALPSRRALLAWPPHPRSPCRCGASSTRANRLMPCLCLRSYASCMSDSPLSRQEIYAAAAAHDELGSEYSDAVVTSFLEKVDKEIDARVDARLAGMRQPAPPAERDHRRTLLKGVAVGISASGLALLAVGGNADERLHRALWVLLLLAVICTAAAGLAGRRLENRRAAIPRPSRPAE
jgi:hypothetical protein